MTTQTFVIPTTDYQMQLDEQDPFFVAMQNATMSANYAKRRQLVDALLKKIRPHISVFMTGQKQQVFTKMRFYTFDDFMTDAAQCAYTNSTLPVDMQVK
jgi:hypothetical protein